MKKRKSRKFCGQLLIFVACLCSVVPLTLHAASSMRSPVQQVMESDAYPPVSHSKWRYTRYGWQKPGDWIRTSSHVTLRTIDHINPILFAIDVLLAALGAMIWASDEWQVARLLGREKADC